MPATKSNELTDLIKKLRTIRRQHEVALEEIENTFRSFGIEHLLDGAKKQKGKPGPKPKGKPGPKPKGTGKRRGRPPKSATAPAKKGKPGPKPKAGRKGKPGPKPKAGKKTRTRGSYAQTGDEFIVSFIAKKGGATTSEIRQAWDKAGRKGKPENNLTGLVKNGKLLRNPTPGKAGSTYSVPAGSTPPASAA